MPVDCVSKQFSSGFLSKIIANTSAVNLEEGNLYCLPHISDEVAPFFKEFVNDTTEDDGTMLQ